MTAPFLLMAHKPPALTIAAVGSLATGVGTVAVSPVNVGDILVLGCRILTDNVATVSGGGVTTWTSLAFAYYASLPLSVQLFMGVVTTAGAATITAIGSDLSQCQEFSKSGGAWAQDGSQGSVTNASSGTPTMPSLIPAAAGELYVGNIGTGGTSLANGSTSGYTYGGQASGGFGGFVFNPACGAGAQAPIWGASNAGWVGVAALIKV